MDLITNVDDEGAVAFVHSPEGLMTFAREGHLSKFALASLLEPDSRQHFLDACAAIEKQFTVDCAAHGDTCLEGGCAMDGEVCLQAVLKAGSAFQQACAAEWIPLFKVEANRSAAWRKAATS